MHQIMTWNLKIEVILYVTDFDNLYAAATKGGVGDIIFSHSGFVVELYSLAHYLQFYLLIILLSMHGVI